MKEIDHIKDLGIVQPKLIYSPSRPSKHNFLPSAEHKIKIDKQHYLHFTY